MKNQKSPLSRKEGIVVQELDGEVLIYDLRGDKAFCLNETSALVWQMCDGEKSIGEISRELSKKLKSPANEDLVWLAIDQLKKEKLIVNGEELVSSLEGLNRREVIKKVGLASMVALPLVTGLIAPVASQAQSAQATCATSGTCSCTVIGATTTGAGCTVNGFGYSGTCSSTGASACFACRTTAPCAAGVTCPGACSTT